MQDGTMALGLPFGASLATASPALLWLHPRCVSLTSSHQGPFVELHDGWLWMLIRSNWGKFWSAYSYDGGRFWRTPQPSGLAASSAPGLLLRLASGRLLLVWNRSLPDGGTD